MIWSVYNKPWLIENSKADWTASAIVITPDWSTHTAATTPDWTERVQPID